MFFPKEQYKLLLFGFFVKFVDIIIDITSYFG